MFLSVPYSRDTLYIVLAVVFLEQVFYLHFVYHIDFSNALVFFLKKALIFLFLTKEWYHLCQTSFFFTVYLLIPFYHKTKRKIKQRD